MAIEEGSIQLELPENHFNKGPGTRTAGFYNKSQKLNRDVTISFLNTVKPRLVLDGFGGTGVRGLRIARELGLRVVISETNKKSYEYILRNRDSNSVDAEVYNESYEAIADRFVFDYIDVDPYGSIIPFVDKAINRVRSGGYIGVTATDLSSLTGSVPAKTRRRYDAYISNDSARHEMGIRLLISYVVRRAAVFDRAAVPLISFWHSHYYRIFFRIRSGSKNADIGLEAIGKINRHHLVSEAYPDIEQGPAWKGNMNSAETLHSLRIPEGLENNTLLRKYLESLGNEDLSVLFLDVTDLAKYLKKDLPRMSRILERLDEFEGIHSARTHFSPTGLKMSSYDIDISDIFRK